MEQPFSFSRYPQFLETSPVGNWPARLDARYEVIIEANRDRLKGARVLDIASHDGRWTFAALDAGAAHVTGIEVRPEMAKAAEKNLASLGVSSSRYEFKVGDIFERAGVFRAGFDVVLCLGFLYHTARHAESLQLIRDTNASLAVIDTGIITQQGNFCAIRREIVNHPAMGHSATGVYDGHILVALPSKGALTMMLRHFGYGVRIVDWSKVITRRGVHFDMDKPLGPNNPLGDYARGFRSTFISTLRK